METMRSTITSAARPLRDIGGLAAPIRSARMRARTDMVKYLNDFHHSGANLPVHVRFTRSKMGLHSKLRLLTPILNNYADWS